jgi:hypothetical protein
VTGWALTWASWAIRLDPVMRVSTSNCCRTIVDGLDHPVVGGGPALGLGSAGQQTRVGELEQADWEAFAGTTDVASRPGLGRVGVASVDSTRIVRPPTVTCTGPPWPAAARGPAEDVCSAEGSLRRCGLEAVQDQRLSSRRDGRLVFVIDVGGGPAPPVCRVIVDLRAVHTAHTDLRTAARDRFAATRRATGLATAVFADALTNILGWPVTVEAVSAWKSSDVPPVDVLPAGTSPTYRVLSRSPRHGSLKNHLLHRTSNDRTDRCRFAASESTHPPN